eukprot:COSAG03_NODE_4854_length_1412_cov_1.152323_1_plen_263_part_00
MMGYLANPALGEEHVAEIKQKTAEAIDENGWLHSGDKGLMDQEGMFKITGRYKELIIGAGGENVAPVPMEDFLKTNEVDGKRYGISDAMMVGDKRKYNVVLLTLQTKGYTGELPGTDELDGAAALVNPAVRTVGEAMTDPVWQEHLTNAIKAVNGNQRACPSNASKIQKFAILPKNFSVEGEEFTPTLKLKRCAVHTLIASSAIFADKPNKSLFTSGALWRSSMQKSSSRCTRERQREAERGRERKAENERRRGRLKRHQPS